MRIKNIEGLSTDQISREIAEGGRFVVFQFTISLIVMTFRKASDIYFVRPGENAIVKGLPYTFITLMLGWWGIPSGPIYSFESLSNSLSGGKDITREVLSAINIPS